MFSSEPTYLLILSEGSNSSLQCSDLLCLLLVDSDLFLNKLCLLLHLLSEPLQKEDKIFWFLIADHPMVPWER